jgi:hypothetical protein
MHIISPVKLMMEVVAVNALIKLTAFSVTLLTMQFTLASNSQNEVNVHA